MTFELLMEDVFPRWRSVFRPLARETGSRQRSEPPELSLALGSDVGERARKLVDLCETLRLQIDEHLATIDELHAGHDDFMARLAIAGNDSERRAYIIDFAAELGATRWSLAADRRALKRWFGADAVTDRYLDRVGAEERALNFRIDRLGASAERAVIEVGPVFGYAETWKLLDLQGLVFRLSEYAGDRRVPATAFLALARAVKSLPPEMGEGIVGELSLRAIYRAAMDRTEDVWVQCAALDLLRQLSTGAFTKVLGRRITRPGSGDDFFVRRHAVQLLESSVADLPDLEALLGDIGKDPSPHVRQGLGYAAVAASDDMALAVLERTCTADEEPTVRASALLAIPAHIRVPARREALVTLLQRVLQNESHPFVLRTALLAVERGFLVLREQDGEAAGMFFRSTRAAVAALHGATGDAAVRTWAARSLERTWCMHDPVAARLYEGLSPLVRAIRPGRSRRIPGRLLAGTPETVLGRVLAVLAQKDFPLELHRGLFGWYLCRGDRLRPRLWRILHEFRHPASDKREAHPHTIGRVYFGNVLAPPGGMGELSETRVPGEPLHIGDEGSWRPWLPLVDQVLSAIDGGRVTRLFTAEGITEIRPPRGFMRQLWARSRITFGFPAYAAMRNWTESSGGEPGDYIAALRRAGVDVQLLPHEIGDGVRPRMNPGVARFFNIVPVVGGVELMRRFENYFFSVYQNTLVDLGIFIGVVAAFFFGRHLLVNHRLRRARDGLALVIGGWGTRGKSGTERLKAALMNGLGHGIVSKTTGCEAMFVFSRPFRPLREMFLFRPYDKATIWEQHQLACMAGTLKTDVFLWECMGLTPSYVEILQRQWMRDDLATITNTYPDHEDLQGPAGYNIPEVMTRFIPRNSILLTTEEEMRPILAEAAARLGTELEGIGWLESGILAPDVLSRFPYEEHPANIALVTALARHLGVDRDFALKEMADRVVPDLGVLKCYPVAEYRHRRLEFVNGMSANERFGCIGNWRRMQFDRQDYRADSGTWIVTVVNNRADREPRSRVFASIIVNDIAVDRHVLIGSNLEGLHGFIEEELAERMRRTSLWTPTEDGRSDPGREIDRWARRLRVPVEDADVAGRCGAILAGLGRGDGSPVAPEVTETSLDGLPDPVRDAALDHVRQQRDMLDRWRAFRDRVAGATDSARADLDREFRELVSATLLEKLVVVANFHASGDEVIDVLCEATPPGMHARVMGMQNIKGTGLDFVYRWQAWDRCHALCMQLESDKPEVALAALRELAAFRDFSPVSEARVRASVAMARTRGFAQNETFQSQLALIQSNLEQRLRESGDAAGSGEPQTRMQRVVLALADSVEHFLDAGDAVRRRRQSRRIYRDLAAQRISLERAAMELQALNKRQKGGWLRYRIVDLVLRMGGRRHGGRGSGN